MDGAEEVKSKLDVADIVGEYLPLKPAGSGSFKALCPFHHEKTPSFYVHRPRQTWHCFGCDQGGDLISFVMHMEGMEFREALEHLAQKAGITLPTFNTKASSERKRLHEINDMAARFYRAQLLQSQDAEHARAYAASRGIDEFTGDLFKIGYAPKGWDALSKTLGQRGISDEELIRAGLANKSDRGGVYDRFRDRLMFAIQDVHGNVAGFTGRLLDPNAKEAKYVNSPETAVYKKSAVLYGLDKAKGEIKSKDLAVICEGNMDVLSSHRIGISHVVCSSGTALTAEQLKLIQRFTKNLAIAFDQDAAGKEATLRGLDLARAQDFSIKIISLPPDIAKDPDEAIMKDPEIWKRAIRDAEDIMGWIFHAAFRNRQPTNADEKRHIAEEILPEIKRIADPIVRDHWMRKLADALGTSADALSEALAKTPVRPFQATKTSAPAKEAHPKKLNRLEDASERLLALLLLRPALFERAKPVQAEILASPYIGLYNRLKTLYDSGQFSGQTSPDDINNVLDNETLRLANYLAIRADRDYSGLSDDAMSAEYDIITQTIRGLGRHAERLQLEEDMRAAERTGDKTRILELAKRFQELT